MRRIHGIEVFACAAFGLAAGCATVAPPDDLVKARQAYQSAQNGTAGKLMPAELYSDKHYLDAAEGSFQQDPGAAKTKDLAYVALRKLQATDARAQTQLAFASKAQAESDGQSRLKTQLKSTKQQLAESSQAFKENQGELSRTREQLDAEKKAREAAEQQLRDALAKFAQVKEEARGTVITLSGSVLFASGKSDLIPAAQDRLGPVADALKSMPKRPMVVEGHTDSRGREQSNQELSLRRADAVRQFLISHGVEESRIRSEGRGPSHPIADNASAEGRANNRRVEIILERAAVDTASSASMPSGASGGSGDGGTR